MRERTSIPVGTLVRVLGTPETLAAELAGLVGRVRQTTAEVKAPDDAIGVNPEGVAILVDFPGPHPETWLSPCLVEVVDDGQKRSAMRPDQAAEFRSMRMENTPTWASVFLARCRQCFWPTRPIEL